MTKPRVLECVECGGEMHYGDAVLAGEYRGKTLSVQMDGFTCRDCGYATVAGRDMSLFRERLQEAYRVEVDQLSGEQIRNTREAMGLTQEAYATYLGVGQASVKRWETGALPEVAMDLLIRMKTDPAVAALNAIDVCWSVSQMTGSLRDLTRVSTYLSAAWESCQSLLAAQPLQLDTHSLADAVNLYRAASPCALMTDYEQILPLLEEATRPYKAPQERPSADSSEQLLASGTELAA